MSWLRLPLSVRRHGGEWAVWCPCTKDHESHKRYRVSAYYHSRKEAVRALLELAGWTDEAINEELSPP